MPPRRSTRTPAATTATKDAAAPKSKSKPTTKKPAAKVAKAEKTEKAPPPSRAKRPAPVDDDSRTPSPAPPAKRRRAAATRATEPEPAEPKAALKVKVNGVVAEANADKENPAPKEKAPPKAKPAPKKKAEKPKVKDQKKPYFNALPTPPEHARPAAQLFVWGTGNFGQFGMGEDHLDEIEKPQRSKVVEQKMEDGEFGEEGAGLEAVAAGGLFSLFVDEKGTVWSSGTNDDAALGRITTNVSNPEKEGEFLDIDTLTANPYPLQSLVDDKFRTVRVAAGDSIAAAISSEGELRVWGSFRSVEGLLGFSSGEKHQFLPAEVLTLKSKPGDVERFVSVAAGNNHLVVLTTHGNVYTWGAGEQGQLGRKVLERRKIHGTTPEKIVLGHRTTKAVAIGAGNYTSFAVDEHGDVWAWGLNNMGQAGTGADGEREPEVQLPHKVKGLCKSELGGTDRVVEIAGGEHHTLFLTEAGKVYACGRSNGGQLGIPLDAPVFKADGGDKTTKDALSAPALVPWPDEEDPVVHIAAGVHNNLATTRGGALYTWGTGPQSELGKPGEEKLDTPTVIVRKEGGAWAAVSGSCGGQHTLALLRKKA